MSDPVVPSEPGYRPTSAHVAGRSWPVRVLGAFSSLKAAATLIAIMAVVTGVATYYERDYGRDAAAVMIYGALWFNLLWLLLAVNIFGAAAVRWPWTRRQWGFVVVHAGLLILMLGFFLDRDRLDGQLIASPGVEAARIDLNEDYLSVIDGSGNDSRKVNVTFQTLQHAGLPSFARYLAAPLAPLPELGIARADRVLLSAAAGDAWRGALTVDAGFPRVSIARVCLAAEDELGFAPADLPGAGSWAARVELAVRTPAMPPGTRQTQGAAWLHAGGKTSLELGPADLAIGRITSEAFLADLLAPAAADAGDGSSLVVYHGGKRFALPIDRPAPISAVLAADLEVVIDRIIERPRFDEKAHELTDDPEAAVDPLLLVRVGTGEAKARQWRIAPAFAFHPAGLAVAPPVGQPELWYDHPSARRGGVGQGLVAQILATPDGGWALVRTSRTHGRQAGVRCPPGQAEWEGPIVGGAGQPMELRLDVQVVANAEPAPVPRPMLPDQRDRAARWIELEIERGTARGRQWIRRDGGDGSGIAAITLDDGSPVLVRYTRAQYDLGQRHGFRIKLERFDEGKDIGGTSTATYASDVQVLPTDGSPAQSRRISMNEPLRINGATLYQSGFEPQRDASGAALPGPVLFSAFTVATSPGRFCKYAGSFVLVAGIILLYIMRRK